MKSKGSLTARAATPADPFPKASAILTPKEMSKTASDLTDREIEAYREAARRRRRREEEEELARIFQYIASQVDHSLPSGRDPHRELLQQMTVEIPEIRPAVLSRHRAGR
jgi:hypothetical protein